MTGVYSLRNRNPFSAGRTDDVVRSYTSLATALLSVAATAASASAFVTFDGTGELAAVAAITIAAAIAADSSAQDWRDAPGSCLSGVGVLTAGDSCAVLEASCPGDIACPGDCCCP